MIKFNSNNIFVGYLKQLLKDFNLPKYRVYTREQEKYFAENGKELNVLETVYRTVSQDYDGKKSVSYPERMCYIPYIKGGKIQEYADGKWHSCHLSFSESHGNGERVADKPYTYNQKELNYTKNLKITNNYYDSYTHEYLGNYLRFQRDYKGINLMPLYNCFSDRLCPKLNINVTNSDYTATFNTADSRYKIYMVPVKLFKDYTIAIDCDSAVEMCCVLYGKYYDNTEKFKSIPKLTYECFNELQFIKPKLYTKISELTTVQGQAFIASDIAQREDDLKLLIKLPINNKSSITILEGDDYTEYVAGSVFSNQADQIIINQKTDLFYAHNSELFNDMSTLRKLLIIPLIDIIENNKFINAPNSNTNSIRTELPKINKLVAGGIAEILAYHEKCINGQEEAISLIKTLTRQEYELALNLWTKISGGSANNGNSVLEQLSTLAKPGNTHKLFMTPHTIINFENLNDVANIKLITPLQLLKANVGESYPIADRLIEYLVDNAITPYDAIGDNVKRVKTVVALNTQANVLSVIPDSLWTDQLQPILYNYIAKYYSNTPINHDILGYVDKDVEQLYSHETYVIVRDNAGNPVVEQIVHYTSEVTNTEGQDMTAIEIALNAEDYAYNTGVAVYKLKWATDMTIASVDLYSGGGE